MSTSERQTITGADVAKVHDVLGDAPADGRREVVPVPMSNGVVAAYESMIAAVPDAGQDAVERILEELATATSGAELVLPWAAEKGKALIGRRLIVQSIEKAESDFEGGLPWFLVVRAAEVVSGEVITFTLGSTMAVAQLVRAYHLGLMPWKCVLVQSERPTRAGYFPQHFETWS